MIQPLLTAQQLAARLSIPLARVYELARVGGLPTVRIGRQIRFDPEALRAWMEAGGWAIDDGPRRVQRR